MSTFFRSFILACIITFQSVAFAGGIGVVDFQKAINEVKEGKEAKAKIDKEFAKKRSELQQKEQALKTQFDSYQKQKSLLDPTVQREQEPRENAP